MVADSVLKRYALAYVKKSSGNDNIKGFLQHCKEIQDLTWSEKNFDKVYGEFIKDQNLNNGQNIGSRGDGYNGGISVNLQALRTYMYTCTIEV